MAFETQATGDPGGIWRLVVLELALAVLSDVLGRANTLCDSLLGDRFTNRVSVRLMQHATELDLASFEDPVFYDKLERARRQTTGRLGLLAAMLNLCAGHGEPGLPLGRADRLFAVADAAAGGGRDAGIPGRDAFHAPWPTRCCTAGRRSAGNWTTCGCSAPARRAPRKSRSSDWAVTWLIDTVRFPSASTRKIKQLRSSGRALGSLLNLVATGGYYGGVRGGADAHAGGGALDRHLHVSDRVVLPVAGLTSSASCRA